MSPTHRKSILWRALRWPYWAAAFSFWFFYLYHIFTSGRPERATELLQTYGRQIWSPTTDPVLNFIADASLILAAAALWLGVIIAGLVLAAVLFGLLVLGAVVRSLALLASLSTTGAVLAWAIGAGAVFLCVRALVRKMRGTRSAGEGAPRPSYLSGGLSSFGESSGTWSREVDEADSSNDIGRHQPEHRGNPLLEASQIWDPLVGESKELWHGNVPLGRIEKAIVGHDRVITRTDGTEAARIIPSIVGSDQIVADTSGREIARITTNFAGETVIRDNDGNERRVTKDFGGNTVIE